MENSSSTMFWVVGGIVLAAAIIVVAKVIFPQITNKIGDFLRRMVDHADSSVSSTFDHDVPKQ